MIFLKKYKKFLYKRDFEDYTKITNLNDLSIKFYKCISHNIYRIYNNEILRIFIRKEIKRTCVENIEIIYGEIINIQYFVNPQCDLSFYIELVNNKIHKTLDVHVKIHKTLDVHVQKRQYGHYFNIKTLLKKVYQL